MMKEKAERGIVFFKSAVRDEYRAKILTALSLPEGFHMHTWYDKEWISEELWSETESNSDKLKGVNGSLIFVDLLEKTPKFYPLRKCAVYSIYLRDERAYLWLEMKEYYKYDEKMLEKFNERLKEAFKEGKLPPDDHSFAQFTDISTIFSDLQSSAGLEAMEKLTKCLTEKPGKNFKKSVFFKFDLIETKSKKMPKVKQIDEVPHILLKEGKWYHINFDYYVPNPEQIRKEGAPELVKVVFTLDDEHFYAPLKTLMIPSTTRIYGRRIDFCCENSGRPEIGIEREDDLHNAPNPLMKTLIRRRLRGIAYSTLFFIGLLITAFPQIYEVPEEFIFIKPVLSLVGGPFISTLAIWLMKQRG